MAVEIHRREVDQLLALAGDAHGLDDDVDLVVLQRGDAIGRRQDAVLDLRRGAEDVAGHLAGDVDVESGDLAGDRVAEAEQVAADVEADDQPAAGPDVGDGVVGLGAVGERPQARGAGRSPRRCSPAAAPAPAAVPPSRPGWAGRARGSAPGSPTSARPQPASTVTAATATQSIRDVMVCRSSRETLITGTRSVAATVPAPPRSPRTTDSTAAPTVAPDSTRRALRMSLRSCLRLSLMPLVSASSSWSNAGVESSSPRPSATCVAAW